MNPTHSESNDELFVSSDISSDFLVQFNELPLFQRAAIKALYAGNEIELGRRLTYLLIPCTIDEARFLETHVFNNPEIPNIGTVLAADYFNVRKALDTVETKMKNSLRFG